MAEPAQQSAQKNGPPAPTPGAPTETRGERQKHTALTRGLGYDDQVAALTPPPLDGAAYLPGGGSERETKWEPGKPEGPAIGGSDGKRSVKQSSKGLEGSLERDLVPKQAKFRRYFRVGTVLCFVEVKPVAKVALTQAHQKDSEKMSVSLKVGGSVSVGATLGVGELGGGCELSGKLSAEAKVDKETGEWSVDALAVPIQGSLQLFLKVGDEKPTLELGGYKLGTLTVPGFSSNGGGGAFDVVGIPAILEIAKLLDAVDTGMEVAEWALNPGGKALKEGVSYVGNEILEGVGLKKSEDEKIADANGEMLQQEGAERTIHEPMPPMFMHYAQEAPAAKEVESAEHLAARSQAGAIKAALDRVGPAAATANGTNGKHTPAAAKHYGSAFSKNALAKQAATRYSGMVAANDASPQKDVHPAATLMAQAREAIRLAEEAIALFAQGDAEQRQGPATS